MENKRYLSRGLDHLGTIGGILRDLKGFSTIAYELIQNAEDARASKIIFNFTKEALIVDNNAKFSDCKQVEEEICPWEKEKGHRCDFHRFRRIMSGDKRKQDGTIGAFGVGFISVYQITDKPELISNGRHWIIDETQTEDKRIEVCKGCDCCQSSDLPGTRFIFPWAKDPNTEFRKKAKVEAITEEKIEKFFQEICRSLWKSLLFLNNVERIEIKRNDFPIKKFERLKLEEDNSLIISDDGKDKICYLIKRDFEEEAKFLKKKYGNSIEENRSSEVILAIPEEFEEKGLLFAFLPTQHEIEIPIYINADFFPDSSRKRIILESDYQSEWNRCALKAAAIILSNNIENLKDKLGYKNLWKLIDRVSKAEGEFKIFWDEISKKLNNSAIIFTSQSEWRKPNEVLLLEKEEEKEAIPLLENLGIPIVHADLRRYFSLLRNIGVSILGIKEFITLLKRLGFVKRKKFDELPKWLKNNEQLEIFWKEIEILLNRRGIKEEEKEELKECAIILGKDNALWPCKEIYRADENTIKLFQKIFPDIPFVHKPNKNKIYELCPKFSPKIAIDYIKRLNNQKLQILYSQDKSIPKELLQWFQKSLEDAGNEYIKKELARLPIYPSTDGDLHSLEELVLPSNFRDPLGLSHILDIERLKGLENFLQALGAKELTLETYILNYLSKSFEKLDEHKKEKGIKFLAENLGKIKYDKIKNKLKNISIVKCEDGNFRKSREVYFKEPEVIEIIGEKAFYAKCELPIIKDFYEWLEVSSKLRLIDIENLIKEIVKTPPDEQLIEKIQKIFAYLGKRFKEEDLKEDLEFLNLKLKELAWLPAENSNKWHKGEELYATFRRYLFSTQGRFLKMSQKIQKDCSEFIEFLGIKKEPEVELVIKHLLECVKRGEKIHTEIYRFLDQKAEEKHLRQLRREKCLFIPPDNFVSPDKVFWRKHPFGKYRYKLSEDLREFTELFKKLGVKEEPDYEDAIKVLLEISEDFGSKNISLGDEEYTIVIKCWEMIQNALEENKIQEEDLKEKFRNKKVIPDRRKLLRKPSHILFEDRPGFVSKFKGLENEIISRYEKAWKAMKAVGVYDLSECLKIEIVESTEQEIDSILNERIKERLNFFKRIFENNEIKVDYSKLEKIIPISTVKLKVKYKLQIPEFSRIFETDSEEIAAILDYNKNKLFFVKQNGQHPWRRIAKELAIFLAPSHKLVSSYIKDIISLDSENEIFKIFDEYEIPPLEQMQQSDIKSEEITEIGSKIKFCPDSENLEINTQKDKKTNGEDSESFINRFDLDERGTEIENNIPENTSENKSGQTEDFWVSEIKNEQWKSEQTKYNYNKPSFPSRPVYNKEKRREGVLESYKQSPEKQYEERLRSIRTTEPPIAPQEDLKNNYTNEDGIMVCQICQKEMPFKKPDGEYYFEAVELFDRDIFPKEHEAQYLALCPTCAARYEIWVKRHSQKKEKMKKIKREILKTDLKKGKLEIPIELDKPATIRFVETHLHDLQTILKTEAT